MDRKPLEWICCALVFSMLIAASAIRAATVSGTVWSDSDRNGAQNGAEAGLSGWTVYHDEDEDASQDGGETGRISLLTVPR